MATLDPKFAGKLSGQVALVTGASRGIGKGAALMLAQAGAIVYITGRKLAEVSKLTGSLTETSSEISANGGRCIPVYCNHANDKEVRQLFDQIKMEQDDRLDILVNNAFSGVQPIDAWDVINHVGLRSNYICSHHAAQLMVPRKKGLIVNISSYGGLRYLFGPAYGVGKEGNDRMAVDMAIELRKHNVAAVSLWPQAVETELIGEFLSRPEVGANYKQIFSYPQHPTFVGKGIVALACDENIMKKSGRVHICSDLGQEYGFTDINGNVPLSFRQVKFFVRYYYPNLAQLIPSFVYMPRWMFYLAGQKF